METLFEIDKINKLAKKLHQRYWTQSSRGLVILSTVVYMWEIDQARLIHFIVLVMTEEDQIPFNI